MKTHPVVNYLTYCSYAYNRDRGMSHEDLLSLGVGDDNMKEIYEKQKAETLIN